MRKPGRRGLTITNIHGRGRRTALAEEQNRTARGGSDDAEAAAPGDKKTLEGILGDLRKEAERLDEDAWMYKKLPF